MVLGYTDVNILNQIIQNKFGVKDNFSYNDINIVLNEYLYNMETYLYKKKDRKKKGYIELVDYFLYRSIANFDTMILLTGQKGTGKSSFAITLAKRWCRMLGKNFNPKRHMAYSNAQVQERIKNLDKFEPLICDEAINFASADEWAKSDNKELVKELGKIRTKHLFFILCWPLKMLNIASKYRNSYVNYWVDVYRRGEGVVFVKDFNPNKEVWNMKAFDKIPSYNEFTPADKVHEFLKKHPNYWAPIKVPKPSKETYDRYLKVREENVYNNQEVFSRITPEDIARAYIILAYRDLIQQNSSIGIRRAILHIENEYGRKIGDNNIKSVITDAEALHKKIQEVKL